MKVILAGSRTILKPEPVLRALSNSGFDVTEIVSGGANGPDSIGEWWAATVGMAVKCFPADWSKYGRAAGPIRNRAMAAYADALVAVWDGESRGTANMIAEAKAQGLAVYIHRVDARGSA